jgi:Xaa-Pro dipeptidase
MSLERFRDWLGGQKMSAACVTDPISIGYLTGFFANPHERVMALVIGSGSAVLVVPGLEHQNAESAAREVEVTAYQDGEDAWALVREALGDRSRLAVEKEHLTLARAEALRAGELLDCGRAIRRLRAIKTPEEVRLLAEAAAITDQVTEAIFAALAVGQAELEVAVRLGELIAEAGCKLSFDSLVQSGPNSAMPHLSPSDRRLQAGDLVLLDFGARFSGYHGDTSRMAVIGPPDERQLEVHRAVLDAHDRAIEAIREGVTAGQVDAAARSAIERAGFGDRFIHRTGHGLGLEGHEDPSLEPGSDYVLEEGMVATVEPGVYIPDWGGIRIEDDVVVERDGARLLTNADRSLKVIAAT